MAEFDHFLLAQDPIQDQVLRELRAGKKTGHWMWFVFPQLKALGQSGMSRRFGLESVEQAQRYLAHDTLGPRLRTCKELVLQVEGRTAIQILGMNDAMKLHSSATLFHLAVPEDPMFKQVLTKYFSGAPDAATLVILASSPQGSDDSA